MEIIYQIMSEFDHYSKKIGIISLKMKIKNLVAMQFYSNKKISLVMDVGPTPIF